MNQKHAVLIKGMMVLVTTLVLFFAPASGKAGEAHVIEAKAQPMKGGTYLIIATIRHADESFAHFANKFEILTPDGTLLATRPLIHPHIDEQPFTRALPRVKIPQGIKQIIIRAHDKLHGFGGEQQLVTLPDR